MVRHHLLEIILWPNIDGTFRKIVNSAARLKELGIYEDYKLTINLSRSDHSKLHASEGHMLGHLWKGKKRGKFSDEHRRKLSESHKGKRKPLSAETKAKIAAKLKGHPHFIKDHIYH